LLSRAAKLHNCQWRWHATPLHSTLPLPLSNQRLAAPFCGTITSAYWKIIALSPECDACHIANPEHRMPLCSWPLFALKAWLRLRRSPKARGSGAWWGAMGGDRSRQRRRRGDLQPSHCGKDLARSWQAANSQHIQEEASGYTAEDLNTLIHLVHCAQFQQGRKLLYLLAKITIITQLQQHIVNISLLIKIIQREILPT